MYEKELQNLGLTEKEAKIYTTSLELGPDTALNIAKQSDINRATTYVQIDSLKEKGLMSEFEKGKKTYYVAESPEVLTNLINKEEVELNFKKLELGRVVPDLVKFYDKISSSKEKPKIRFFEGEEGVTQIRADVLKEKNSELFAFMNLDHVMQKFAKNQDSYTKKRLDQKIKSKIIYTSRAGQWKGNDPEVKLREMKYVSTKRFPFDADVTIYRDKVALVSYKSDAVGVIIESKPIADTLKSLFWLLWESV